MKENEGGKKREDTVEEAVSIVRQVTIDHWGGQRREYGPTKQPKEMPHSFSLVGLM